MALGIYSGKDAYVNGVGCTQSWQATEAVSAQRYTASCTPGATNVTPGIENWTGAMSGIGAFPQAVIPDGADFAFAGTVNDDAGQGDLLTLSGSAIIEQLTIDINKETAAPISWQATMGFQGTPTESAAGDADASDPAADYWGDALDIKMHATTPVTIASASCCIRTAQIVLRRQVTSFVKNGATYRKSGVLECDINFGVYNPSLKTVAYAKNTLTKLQIWVSAVSYWEFALIRMLGKSGLQVDRGSNNILGYTVNGQWNSKKVTSGAAVKGHIGFYYGESGSEGWTMVYGDEP